MSHVRITLAGTLRRIKRGQALYWMLLPAVVYFAIFNYWPMYGVLISFKNYEPFRGFFASPWVGLSQFTAFFHSGVFWNLIKNTLTLSVYSFVVGFPVPILLALLLDQVNHSGFKKWVTTVLFAPNFLSIVVVVGMLNIFLAPSTGLVNIALTHLGLNSVYFMGDPGWFSSVYVWSGVWQGAGVAMIIYLAALSAVDPALHEVAIIDGASKWKRIIYIDLPSIMPTIVVVFLLSVGSLMSVAFDKVYLMQNPQNFGSSQVISTYVYQQGLLDFQFSYSTAVGMFNAVINSVLLIVMNSVAKRAAKTSLW